MEEAERLCDRIGIIDGGRILAEGTRAELVALVGELDHVRLDAGGDLQAAAAAIRDLKGVERVTVADAAIEVSATSSRTLLPAIITTAAGTDVTMRSIEVTEPDLEAVFLHLTGRALRD
jgi:ABC-2 type transport system ATP-binding protein